mmetsp:Transcript_4797/g.8525  ORF Transcript_4797/g.8525 Transcript_4797/m.8525 type:complete len:88 (+) Transcript_4797:179-442(+)
MLQCRGVKKESPAILNLELQCKVLQESSCFLIWLTSNLPTCILAPSTRNECSACQPKIIASNFSPASSVFSVASLDCYNAGLWQEIL